MKAIILAAGRGSRLKAMTDEKPKCLVEMFEKPLIQWQLTALKKAGIDTVGVVTGYKSELLQKYGEAHFKNENWQNTNMVESLVCAKSFLAESECIVSYSDIVYHSQIVEKLAAARGDICITYDRNWLELWSLRFADPLSDAESFILDADQRLIEIGQKTPDMKRIQGQYMGLLKITPTGWKKIQSVLQPLSPSERNKLDMTSLLSLLLRNKERIVTVEIVGRWCEVDNQEDLSRYLEKLKGEGWSHDFRF